MSRLGAKTSNDLWGQWTLEPVFPLLKLSALITMTSIFLGNTWLHFNKYHQFSFKTLSNEIVFYRNIQNKKGFASQTFLQWGKCHKEWVKEKRALNNWKITIYHSLLLHCCIVLKKHADWKVNLYLGFSLLSVFQCSLEVTFTVFIFRNKENILVFYYIILLYILLYI